MKCKKCEEDINLDNSYNFSLTETYLDNKREILLAITCPSCKREMIHFIDEDDIS